MNGLKKLKQLRLDKVCLRCFTSKPDYDFHKDSSRKDNLDVWCKECRREWRATTTRKYKLLDNKDPYINLILPSTCKWPSTHMFNSGTRRAADIVVKNGKIVIVTTQAIESPVWFWRQWDQAAFRDIFEFFQWLAHAKK